MHPLPRWVLFFSRGAPGLDRTKGDRLAWLGAGAGSRARRGHGHHWSRASPHTVLAEDPGPQRGLLMQRSQTELGLELKSLAF